MARDPILVVVFLRGGMDGLNMVGPSGDADYIAARPEELRVLREGDERGFALKDQAADVDFRFHHQAKAFSELFEAGELALIHASGLTDGTRSHFDAEDRIERSTASPHGGGWIGRWLNAARPDGILPVLAASGSAPDMLGGSQDVAVASALQELILGGGPELAPLLVKRLREGFGTHGLLTQPLERLIALSDALSSRILSESGDVLPYVTKVNYPDNELAQGFKTVAQAVKLDLGLRVATVDFGGWDTHNDQAGRFSGRVRALSRALMAFWRDLGNERERVTVVLQSEFGRRLVPNTAMGTDHGFGNVMMVLGGAVKGGQMYGDWPGLANDQLDDHADLAITTDYRHVLAEVMQLHMGVGDLHVPFPDFTPRPVGLFI
jgi:uncharacterized protein (DUF1501 family)